MSRRYQNYEGCAYIDRLNSVRLENTSIAIPCSTATSAAVAYTFMVTERDSTGVHWLWRAGAATTNNPVMGLRHDPSASNTIIPRWRTSAATSLATFSISDNVPYCLVVCWNSAGLSSTDHPDVSGTQYSICYLYNLSTRTPTATVITSNAAALANLLNGGTDDSGMNFQSQSERTSFRAGHHAIWWGSALTRTICNQIGQRTRDMLKVATVPDHYWRLDNRTATDDAVTTMSASPTAGSREERALQDTIGSAHLTPNGAASNLPSWVSTQLRQAITSTEDQRLDSSITDPIPLTYNLSPVHTAIHAGPCTIVGKWHDSFGRPNLVARSGGHCTSAYVDAGFNVIGTTSYLNSGLAGGSSLRTGVALVGGDTDVDLYFLANGANEGALENGNFSNYTGAGATEFGLPIGGLAEIVFGASATFSNGITFRIRSSCGDAAAGSDADWWSSGDKIGILPVIYRTDVAGDRFNGTLRFTTSAEPSGVDWELNDLTSYRKLPRADSNGVASAWTDIVAGTGGISAGLNNTLVAYKNYIVCGTGNSSYDITVTAPTGTLANKRLYLTVIAFKLDANDRPVTGSNCVFVMHMGDDSADLNSDFTTSQLPSDPDSRGDKHFTNDQMADWYSIIAPVRGTNVCQWMDLATENGNEATTLTRCRSFIGSADSSSPRLYYSLVTSAGLTGTIIPGFIDQFTHKITNDGQAWDDGSQMMEVAPAFYAAALNSGGVAPVDGAFVSWGKWSGRYWGFPVASEADFSEAALSESWEAIADTEVMTRLGISNGIITNADRLHLGSSTVAKAFEYFLVESIADAPLITGGSAFGYARISSSISIGL